MVQTYVRSEKSKNNKIPNYNGRYFYQSSSCMSESRGYDRHKNYNNCKTLKSSKSEFKNRHLNFNLKDKSVKRDKNYKKFTYWKEWHQYLTAVTDSNAINYHYNNGIIENLTLEFKSKETGEDRNKFTRKRSIKCRSHSPFVKCNSKQKEKLHRARENSRNKDKKKKKNSSWRSFYSKRCVKKLRYEYNNKSFQKNLYTKGIKNRRDKDKSKNKHDRTKHTDISNNKIVDRKFKPLDEQSFTKV